ncbi:MAG: YciI family protein [Micrococcales bacterium]
MKTFAVTYTYAATPEDLAAVRPTHREWLADQLSAGNLLASGPMVDMPTALLIWRAESLEELAQLLDQDPFDIAGYIGERTIAEWNPVFGPWS